MTNMGPERQLDAHVRPPSLAPPDDDGYSGYPVTIGNLPFIPGFNEGVNMMNFGDKLMLYIPSNLGYGQQGAGDVIPPNANIVFEVELLEIK